MAATAITTGLGEAVVFLGSAAIMVPLFARFRLGAVLGYLMAGLLIGPNGIGLISDSSDIMQFGEYGIVLLLFVIGLDVHPSKLWAMKSDIFGFGTAQIVVTGLALTAMLLQLTSFSWQSALVVGLSLALSSTALVVQYLEERGQLQTREGERVFSVLLMQDLALVPLLLVVSSLSRTPDTGEVGGWGLVLAGVGTIIALILVGRFVFNPLMRMAGQVGTRDIFVIAALLAVLGASYLMASFGLSMALGAFIAGVMLADSPYRYELEVDIEPFRGVLLGLFFLAIGMTIDISVLLHDPLLVLKLLAALLALKTLSIAALARLFGTPAGQALPMGLLLSQGGEFAFVLLAAAVSGILIAPEAASLFTAVVTLSMVASLLLVKLYRTLPVGRKSLILSKWEEPPPDPEAAGSVILVGCGRFGEIVLQLLRDRGVNVVLIDHQPLHVKLLRDRGWKAHYGDGFRLDVLRAAGAGKARLLVIAAGGSWDPRRLEAARNAFPDLVILVRAHDREHCEQLLQSGMRLVIIPELFHSAVELGRRALVEIGTPTDAIDEILRGFLRRDFGGGQFSMVRGAVDFPSPIPDPPMARSAVGEAGAVGAVGPGSADAA